MSPWVEGWNVVGSSGTEYRVSRQADGTYGCSCLGWTRHVPRRDCKHIKAMKLTLGGSKEESVNFYKCFFCGKAFTALTALSEHYRTCKCNEAGELPSAFRYSKTFPKPEPVSTQAVEVDGKPFTVRKFKFQFAGE